MQYFYDLEFNQYMEDHRIELISIGIVADDGREYYAVNRNMDVDALLANEWLKENVWPHLPAMSSGVYKGLSQMANEIPEFIGGTRESNELWAYYGAYDHVVMCRELWGGMNDLPVNIPMWTHELMQLWELAGRPPKPPTPVNEHDALVDARWNKKLHARCKQVLRDVDIDREALAAALTEYERVLQQRKIVINIDDRKPLINPNVPWRPRKKRG